MAWKVDNAVLFCNIGSKKSSHKFPTMWEQILSCKLLNNRKMQKMKQLRFFSQKVQPPLPTILQNLLTQVLFLLLKNQRLTLTSHHSWQLWYLLVKVDDLTLCWTFTYTKCKQNVSKTVSNNQRYHRCLQKSSPVIHLTSCHCLPRSNHIDTAMRLNQYP